MSRLCPAAEHGKRACSHFKVEYIDRTTCTTLYIYGIIVVPQTAEEKLREHWRSNCPDLRRLESRQMQRAVEEEWKEQIEQRQEVWYRLKGFVEYFQLVVLNCTFLLHVGFGISQEGRRKVHKTNGVSVFEAGRERATIVSDDRVFVVTTEQTLTVFTVYVYQRLTIYTGSAWICMPSPLFLPCVRATEYDTINWRGH